MDEGKFWLALWAIILGAIGGTLCVVVATDNAWRKARDAEVGAMVRAGHSPIAAGCALGTSRSDVCFLVAAGQEVKP